MFIALEGADGVGKTTVAGLLADKLHCQFIEKPFHLLLDPENSEADYRKISAQINACSPDVRAWFYGTGMLYLSEKYAEQDIITDRYFLSSYAWNYAGNDTALFELLLRQAKIPDLTVLLTASPAVTEQRIRSRDPQDPDLVKRKGSEERLEKMRYFIRKYRIPAVEIDTGTLSPSEVCSRILKCLQDISR